MANIIGNGHVRKAPRIISRKAPPLQNRKLKEYQAPSSVSTINSSGIYKSKALPGMADEVESYPCRYCSDRIFLTGAFLEKHAKEEHPAYVQEIVNDIFAISSEWKKREFENARARERIALDRMRHEAKANALVRATMNGDVLENTDTIDRYEACPICNVLINTSHPTAMDSHQRAHKKNDQLRMQLLEQYGADVVRRLMCESCSLVFTDDQKLQSHISTHHFRRKRYICKYCGHISQSMVELNLHKTDVHNIVLPSRSTSDEWSVVPEYMRAKRHYYNSNDNSGKKRKMLQTGNARRTQIGEISEGDTPCNVNCPDCGLKLNRPLLLVKHMARVHSKREFSCVVESGGLPSFGIDVENSRIYWNCCSLKFEERRDFIEHRWTHIPVEECEEENEPITLEQPEDEQVNFEGQLVQGPDGTMQILLPEGMEISGDMYLLMDPDQEYDGEKGSTKVRLIQGPRGDIEQVHDGEIIDVPDDQQILTMSQEQFEQMQMQLSDWGGVDYVMVNEDQGVEENRVEPIVEHVEHVDDDSKDSNLINGTPLFD